MIVCNLTGTSESTVILVSMLYQKICGIKLWVPATLYFILQHILLNKQNFNDVYVQTFLVHLV